MISKWENPSFICPRQHHLSFAARAAMEFTPQSANQESDLVLLQNSASQYRFVYTLANGRTVIRLIKRVAGEDMVLAEKPVSDGR